LKRPLLLKNKNHNAILRLFTTHSWLLILDGFDEVPQVSRTLVLEAVMDFILTIERLQVKDVVVLITSRPLDDSVYGPQLKDFKQQVMPALNDATMDKEVARLLGLIYKTDLEKVTETWNDNKETIKPLLTSPLNLTIMVATTILQKQRNHYSMFKDYYNYIQRREGEKSDISRPNVIFMIHQLVAYFLTLKETTKASQFISELELKQIVNALFTIAKIPAEEVSTSIQLIRHMHHLAIDESGNGYRFLLPAFRSFLVAELGRSIDDDAGKEYRKAIIVRGLLEEETTWGDITKYIAISLVAKEALPWFKSLNTISDYKLGSQLALLAIEHGYSDIPAYRQKLWQIASELLDSPGLTCRLIDTICGIQTNDKSLGKWNNLKGDINEAALMKHLKNLDDRSAKEQLANLILELELPRALSYSDEELKFPDLE